MFANERRVRVIHNGLWSISFSRIEKGAMW